jgi:hypothetical protein
MGLVHKHSVFLIFVVATVSLVRRPAPVPRTIWLLVFLVLTSCLAILSMGTAWYWDNQNGYHPEQTELPLNMLAALSIASFLAIVVCICLARGRRVAAIGIALPGIWYGLWCYFVAAMSISGDWL